jgi:hypothetical protein
LAALAPDWDFVAYARVYGALLALSGVGIAAGSVAGLLISETSGLFGVMKDGYRSAIVLSLTFEAVTILLLGIYVIQARARKCRARCKSARPTRATAASRSTSRSRAPRSSQDERAAVDDTATARGRSAERARGCSTRPTHIRLAVDATMTRLDGELEIEATELADQREPAMTWSRWASCEARAISRPRRPPPRRAPAMNAVTCSEVGAPPALTYTAPTTADVLVAVPSVVRHGVP